HSLPQMVTGSVQLLECLGADWSLLHDKPRPCRVATNRDWLECMHSEHRRQKFSQLLVALSLALAPHVAHITLAPLGKAVNFAARLAECIPNALRIDAAEHTLLLFEFVFIHTPLTSATINSNGLQLLHARVPEKSDCHGLSTDGVVLA